MSDHEQSQQSLVRRAHWKAYEQNAQAGYGCDPADSALGVTVCTSVALNGSVKRNGAAMARAAENVARWKIYLPEDCVRAMMNAGWHWST